MVYPIKRTVLLAAFMAALLPAVPVLGGPSELVAEVKVDTANIRTGPGTGYKVATTFVRGQKIKILDQWGDWYRLEMPRTGQGWVFGRNIDFLEITDGKQPVEVVLHTVSAEDAKHYLSRHHYAR